MAGSSKFPKRLVGIGLVSLSIAACQLALGDDTSSGRVVGTDQLNDGVSLRLAPGAVRSTDAPPVAWLSVPTATITLTSSEESPGETSLMLSNVAPDGTLSVRDIRPVTSSDDPDCSGGDNQIDCSQSDSPLCQRGTFESDSATRGELTIQLPTCREFVLDVTPAAFKRSDRGATVAVVGTTPDPRRIDDAARAAADSNADMLVLLGDHTRRRDDSPVRRLSSNTDDLPLPIVLVPGERERTDNSVVDFERTFGPVDLQWRTGGVVFNAPDTSAGGLGREGISNLRDQLSPVDRSATLALFMHRPPLDPNGARDRGFTSRIEGARTLSLLSDFDTDALIADHLGTSVRTTLGDTPLHVVSSTDPRRLLLVDFPPAGASIQRSWVEY